MAAAAKVSHLLPFAAQVSLQLHAAGAEDLYILIISAFVSCAHPQVCRRCGEQKAAADFCRKKQRSDGLDSYCKDCNCKATAARTARKAPTVMPTVEHKVGLLAWLCLEMQVPAALHPSVALIDHSLHGSWGPHEPLMSP